MAYQGSKVDTSIAFAGQWLLSLSSFLFVFFGLAGQIVRPSVLFATFVLGVAAYLVLAARRASLLPVAIAATIVLAVGSVAGGLLYYLRQAIESKSWGVVVALSLASLVMGGVALKSSAFRSPTGALPSNKALERSRDG